ncbi:hypothetical protein V8C35DRAFT_307718 [Trichoderma chlorosporum]
MAHQTDSITIHDVIKFLQGFDINDRFLTVVEKEDGFSYICRLILPLIFRHASQSKLPSDGNSLPRIQRIQKIAALEGIFPKLPSSPKYTTTLEDSQSLEQSSPPDRNESPEHSTTLENSQSLEQSSTPDRNETQESTSPQQCTSIAANTLCADSPSPPADGSTPTALMPETVKFQDSAIELSDGESEENSLSSSSPQAIEHGQITPGDPKTTTNRIPIAEDQDEDETPDYTTLASTIKTSLRFPLWSDSPESFWNDSKETLDPKDYSLITNPKVFVKGALDQKSQLDAKILQDRFYSILIYKLYEKVIASPRVIPALVKQFLDIIGLPSDSTSQSFCSRLIHGGRRREEFCRRVTPNGHRTDYGVLLIPELGDASWEQSNNKRVRDSYNATVGSFEAQNIFSWSERSGARSAANSIISSRQPLLDHFQTQYDKIQGQKRRVEYTESSSSKRIQSDPISQPPSQARSPSIVQDAQASYDNAQAAYDNANQMNLSMRADESALNPSVDTLNIYLPSVVNSSNNGHNGTHLLFEGMGYPDFNFSGLGYEGEDSYDEDLYSQLLYFAQQERSQ